jgi:hypothetical protein
VIKAFRESESNHLPVALLINAYDLHGEIEFEQQQGLKKVFKYTRNILDHVVHPVFADYQFKLFMSNKLNIGDGTVPRPQIPNYPNSLSTKQLVTAKKYEDLFMVLKNYKGDIITGDTSISSIFCLPPYDVIDMVTYLGGSIPLAIGAKLSGLKNVWAVTGDFGFVAAGHLGLIEALNRQININVIILNNKESAATGGQAVPGYVFKHLILHYNKYIMQITDAHNPFEINNTLEQAAAANELSVIVVDC